MVLLTLSASPVNAPFCVFCAGDVSRHGVSLAHKAADSFRIAHHHALGTVLVDGASWGSSWVPVTPGPLNGQRPGVPIRHPVLRI